MPQGMPQPTAVVPHDPLLLYSQGGKKCQIQIGIGLVVLSDHDMKQFALQGPRID